jgi:stage V sporulation protein G
MIRITEVKVYPVRSSDKDRRLKAYATVVFEGCFIVRDLKVILGNDDKLFVSMPSRRSKYGTFRDIAHPLNSQMRTEIEAKVIGEFERAAASGVSSDDSYDVE